MIEAREFWNIYCKLANYEQDEVERESNRLARMSEQARERSLNGVRSDLRPCIVYLTNQKLELKGAA